MLATTTYIETLSESASFSINTADAESDIDSSFASDIVQSIQSAAAPDVSVLASTPYMAVTSYVAPSETSMAAPHSSYPAVKTLIITTTATTTDFTPDQPTETLVASSSPLSIKIVITTASEPEIDGGKLGDEKPHDEQPSVDDGSLMVAYFDEPLGVVFTLPIDLSGLDRQFEVLSD